jgi:hypothetical protein
MRSDTTGYGKERKGKEKPHPDPFTSSYANSTEGKFITPLI